MYYRYFTYKLKIIDFKQMTRTTHQNNKITIPIIKTLKSSRYIAKVGLELMIDNTQNSNFL